MPVVISLLRGVNLGGHRKISMDALRSLYQSLGLNHARTYVQSGNVVFQARAQDLARLGKRIEDGIERTFGFRSDVILRTCSELRDVIAKNPFAARPGIEPSRLLVTFLAGEPGPEAREKALRIKADPEELRIGGRELYIWYPNGVGRAKLTIPLLERTLGMSGTGRNWNTVTKLLEMAETLQTETSPRRH
jgi:uncharacterized protein (DUF1697 family)